MSSRSAVIVPSNHQTADRRSDWSAVRNRGTETEGTLTYKETGREKISLQEGPRLGKESLEGKMQDTSDFSPRNSGIPCTRNVNG